MHIDPKHIRLSPTGLPVMPGSIIHAWIDGESHLTRAMFAATNPGCMNDSDCSNTSNTGDCQNDNLCGDTTNSGRCTNLSKCVIGDSDGPEDP